MPAVSSTCERGKRAYLPDSVANRPFLSMNTRLGDSSFTGVSYTRDEGSARQALPLSCSKNSRTDMTQVNLSTVIW